MPLFSLIPLEDGFKPLDFTADGNSQVLNMIHRSGWTGADVLCDGEYVYSVALSDQGFWSITQEPHRDRWPPLKVAHASEASAD